MMRSVWVVAWISLLSSLCPTPSAAQDAPDQPVAEAGGEAGLNLFFDCQRSSACDLDFMRREVPLVNWVRDREVSDVHVLVTPQPTGGGGTLFTLSFIGRGDFEGDDRELTVGTSGDATNDDERRAVAERLKTGLVPYLAQTPAVELISVTLGDTAAGGGPGNAAGGAGPRLVQEDSWDFWVFRVGGNAFLRGESSYTNSNFGANVSANRTTEEWKFNFSGRYSRNRSEFVIDDTIPPVVSLIEDVNISSLLVKSLTGQWSLGVRLGAGRASRLNEDVRLNVSPGVEYNFVPYSESSRRAFTLQALLNVRHWNYTQETIYFETAEWRVAPSLTFGVNQVQPWGRTDLSITGSQYVHDLSLYQVSVNGSVSLRLFRGFSVNVGGYYRLIRDQLFLPAGSASTAEILLRQRQLQTSYEYFTSFGLSYQFGSIFNNVVNPRFGGGGGFIIFG